MIRPTIVTGMFQEYGADTFSAGETGAFHADGKRACATPSSPPAFHLRPELGKGAEFCASADEHVDVAFQRVRIIRRRAHELDFVPELFERFLLVVENNHAIA